MRSFVLSALVLLTSTGLLIAQDSDSAHAADGFQLPVGPNGTGEGYYVARGYRPNGHLGEDWNGTKGGDTDMGDPVYACAHGLVLFAKNYHVGWGNVVIIRHAYYEGSDLKFVDSLYGHLLDFNVTEGQEVKRGQLIAHIGNNNGMYDAHLHFEMRKNLAIGMYRSSFARDFSNYWSPSEFIAAHRVCPRGNRSVSMPVNTFPASAPPSYAGAKVYTPVYAPGNAPENPAIVSVPTLPPASGRFAETPRTTTFKPPAIALAPVATPAPTPAPKLAAATPAPLKSKSATAAKLALTTPVPAKPGTTASASTKTGGKAAPTPHPASEPTVITALDDDAYEPPLPRTSDGPIRRGSGSFRVDRFEDLRGKGY